MNGQLKWQTLSLISALEQRLKRRNVHAKQQDRLQIQRPRTIIYLQDCMLPFALLYFR